MKHRLTLILSFIIIALVMTSSRPAVTIFMIGDSTMANKKLDNDNQERGWGQMLTGMVNTGYIVDNHAVNGRSTKSFIDEGRWDKVLGLIKPGDFVIIQFGHNDEKADEKRHTDPGTTFDANLRRFCTEAKAKGAIPIIMNSVVRRNFARKTDLAKAIALDDKRLATTSASSEEGDTLYDTHGAYLTSARNVATEQNVTFIDANSITHALEQGLGREKSKNLHMVYAPSEHPSLPDGRNDNTHYNIYGATIVAQLLAKEIMEKVPSLKKAFTITDFVVSQKGCGKYTSIEEAVKVAPRKATIIIHDGEYNLPKKEIKDKKLKVVKYK